MALFQLLSLSDMDDIAPVQIGGKAGNLLILARSGIRVPDLLGRAGGGVPGPPQGARV